MTKNLKKLFIGEFISQCVAIYTMYSIMFSDRSGLDASKVGIILSVFALTTLLAEVPTGVIADKLSRKYSMILSKLFLSLGMIVWLFFPSFIGYLLGTVLFGISESMASGAIQAYIYDDLEDKKRFTKLNTRLWVAMMCGFLVGSGLASIVGPNYVLLLTLSIVPPIIGALIFTTLDSDRHLSKQSEGHKPLRFTFEAARYVISRQELLFASLTIISLKAMVDLLIEYIPMYYRDVGVQIRFVPLVLFIGNAITIVLFWHGTKVAGLIKRRELTFVAVLLAVFLASRFGGTIIAVLGIFWFIRFTRILYVFEEGEIQHMYISKYRATMTSINSMVVRLVMAISMVTIGYAATHFDGKVTNPIMIATTLFVLAFIVFRSKVRKVENGQASEQ